jgi:hypothetical protein
MKLARSVVLVGDRFVLPEAGRYGAIVTKISLIATLWMLTFA